MSLRFDPISSIDAPATTSNDGIGACDSSISTVRSSRRCSRSCSRSRSRERLARSEEHTSELQSLRHLVCRLLLEKKKKDKHTKTKSKDPPSDTMQTGTETD